MLIDVIFTNGRIRTLDPARPTAQRMGVVYGRIVGFDSDLDGVSATQTVDLRGRPVLPGFHDAHYHLSLSGARLASLDLRPNRIASLAELYAAVGAFAEKLPQGGWVRGSGYDQNYLEGHPTAEGLDAVSGGRPVLLEHVSAHMVVVNSAAFALMESVPDVDGGTVGRDAKGNPVGLLQERAMSLAYALVRPIPLSDVQRNLALAGEQTARYGLTSVTDPGVGDPHMLGNSPADFHSYQLAVESGAVKTRITLMPFCTTLHPIFKEGEHAAWRGLDLGMRTGLGDDRLRLGPVKIMADGSFIGRSAAMHHCYHGEAHNRGVMMFPPDKLREMVVGAHAAGWSVAAHAIGDAATDHVLDAFEAAQAAHPRVDTRHRIEHFAYTSAEQVARVRALGVIPVPQGIFISDFGDGMLAAAPTNDRGEKEVIYRCKTLLDAGIVLPGSTDCPVSDGNPLPCIHDMVNRRTRSGDICEPAESITVEEAVRAYTYGSAYAVHQEMDKGTLERGKLADFVVLSNDLFEIAPETIKDQSVLMTVIGGEVVYNAEK
jgi:predicted amidohydrolase YtcJ